MGILFSDGSDAVDLVDLEQLVEAIGVPYNKVHGFSFADRFQELYQLTDAQLICRQPRDQKAGCSQSVSEGHSDDDGSSSFVASATYSGNRPGAVSKLGPLGLGYYLDTTSNTATVAPASRLNNSHRNGTSSDSDVSDSVAFGGYFSESGDSDHYNEGPLDNDNWSTTSVGDPESHGWLTPATIYGD